MSRCSLIIFIIGIFLLWVAAWLLHQSWLGFLNRQTGYELTYWATMKALVWVVYPWLYWRKKLPNLRDFIGLSPTTMQRGYRWGSIATVIWLVGLLLVNLLTKKEFVGVDTWATYIYVITLTPIFEEIMFRGFILSGLQKLGMEGKRANVVTTVLFILIHCVGWAFQGVLVHTLGSTVWISIALVSLVAGFIRIHSGSLRASILLHMGNNAFAGLLG